MSNNDLDGWRVLVTSGGTREPIDPVRYLGNRSSGKMGNAIAMEASVRGAMVTLVTTVAPPELNGEVIQVETAEEMAAAVWAIAAESDVVVMAAAVADFRPRDEADAKLRRSDGPPVIELTPTPDVLAGVVERAPETFVVGFAAETGSLERAVSKARDKGVDLLVANDVLADGSGFSTDTNQVTIVYPDGTVDPWPLITKAEVAGRLWNLIRSLRAPAD